MRIPGYTFIEGVGSLERDPKLDIVQGLIIHVTGTLVSPLNFFDGPSNGIESTIYCPRNEEDRREQYRDTLREADANFRANSWVDAEGKRHGYTSFELMGLANGTYNKFQLSEIKRVAKILSTEHDWPLKVPTGPKSKGLGFHTQFEDWSNAPGKVCPGPNRKEQYWEIIVPWMEQQREEARFYTADDDDTVVTIANRFDLTVAQLWRMNQEVRLPVQKGTKFRIQ